MHPRGLPLWAHVDDAACCKSERPRVEYRDVDQTCPHNPNRIVFYRFHQGLLGEEVYARKRPSLVIIGGLLMLIAAFVAAELLFATRFLPARLTAGSSPPGAGEVDRGDAEARRDSFMTWSVATIGGAAVLFAVQYR